MRNQPDRLTGHDALEHLVARSQAALSQPDPLTIIQETSIMALQQVRRGWVSAGQAASILAETAKRLNDEPEKVALCRASTVSLARKAEESENDP